MAMKLIALFGALFCVLGGTFCETVRYKCSQRELDKLDSSFARIMSVSKYQRKIPETFSQLSAYCNATKPDFKFMEDQLKKCLTGSVKQLGSVFMYSVKSALRQNCQAKNRKVVESRFPISKCLNLVTKDTDICMEKMISAIQRGKRAEPKNRIGYVCCSYYEYRLCVDGKARPRCPPKVADMILEYFSGVFQGVISTACGDFPEESDRCDKLPPPPPKSSPDVKVKSLFYPVVELWNSL